MPVSMKRGRQSLFTLIAGSAAALAAADLNASPTVDFAISVEGGLAGTESFMFTQSGTPTAMPGVFNYQQSGSPYPTGITGLFSEWSISVWNFNADGNPDGTGGATGAKINSAFTVTNNMAEAADPNANHLFFSIMVTMPVAPMAAGTMFFGNGGMTINSPGGANDAELSAVGGSIWNFMAGGSDVASLFQDGFVLGLTGAGTNGTSANLGSSQTSPLIGTAPTSLGIRLDFDLTPGETVTFNGAFGFIPAPGGLALLGLAGLMGGGRRRR